MEAVKWGSLLEVAYQKIRHSMIRSIRKESLIGRRGLRSYVKLSTIVKFGKGVVIARGLSTLGK